MSDEIFVIHDEQRNCFFSTVRGKVSQLEYSIKDKRILDFYRIYVPPELRGIGIAAKITAKGMEIARDKGFLVRATCPYVANFIHTHTSEYNDIILH